MSEDAKSAVFLSYASQDAEAARRICDALRAAGVEVWFDRSELRGGDAWDANIRTQIGECALFVPIVSAATQARREGYFRLEWKLADERTHLMAEGTPFLVPVTIDGTTERGALVPKSFLAVQWTKLPGGETTVEFAGRVRKLLGRSSGTGTLSGFGNHGQDARATTRQPSRTSTAAWIGVIALAGAAVVFFTRKAAPTGTVEPPKPAAKTESAARVNEKWIAVLPFENLSVEPDSAYFAEGIHGEVLTAVGKISALTVIGRTSVLPFADVKKRNLRQIGAELGVATVVEGRVLRADNQVKITVELIDTQTGRQLWSKTFERELKDVFAIQAAIAQEVATTLKAGLTADERTLIERRLTQNPVAYELYLRARVIEEGLTTRSSLERYEEVASAWQRVVAEDPGFGLAYAQLTLVQARIYWFGYMDATPARRARAEAAMRAAMRIAPDAPETYYARGAVDYFCDNEWVRALANYRHAEVGLPNDASLQGIIGYAHRRLGNWPEAVRQLERAVALNPRNLYDGLELAVFLSELRRFEAARQLAGRFSTLFPGDSFARELLIRAEFSLDGDRAKFLRSMAAVPPSGRDPLGLRAEYERNLWAHDFAAAERTLTDPRLAHIVDRSGVISEPVALHRALVAFLLGKHEAAQKFSAEALAEYGRGSWNYRQRPFVMLGMAEAKAFAGRAGEAVREAQAALTLAEKQDRYGWAFAMVEAGRMYAAIDRREEALSILQELMKGISRFSPNEIRIDPLWSRLRGDPRFEEILKSAKPL